MSNLVPPEVIFAMLDRIEKRTRENRVDKDNLLIKQHDFNLLINYSRTVALAYANGVFEHERTH